MRKRCGGGGEWPLSHCFHESYRQHADVVLLAELFGGFGDCLRGLIADDLRALETEEFALLVRSLDNAIGDEGQPVAGSQIVVGFGIAAIRKNAQRQAGIDGQFFSVEIRSQVPSVGEGHGAVGCYQCSGAK